MEAEISVALLISAISTVFGIYAGVSAIRRGYRADNRKESADLTTVIVKLEGISEGIGEIKKDILHVKGDIKEITERLIVAEQSVKLAHSRLDGLYKRNERRRENEGKRKDT